jgi:probable rRNA maturation factor
LRFTPAKLGKLFATLELQSGPHPPNGELSVAFLTDKALAGIHEQFMDDPTPTDVITFPSEDETLAGEICVSVDRAAAEAAQRRQPFARELTLYLVHGWLHLAGLDDLTAKGRQAMRLSERRLLAAVARTRAQPDFRLA